MSHQTSEWIARTPDVQVRILTLAPGGATPWHYHRHVSDDTFGLEHGVEVALRDPEEVRPLGPGGRVHVEPGRVHRVVNRAGAPRRYLLIQATGPYDFNEVP